MSFLVGTQLTKLIDYSNYMRIHYLSFLEASYSERISRKLPNRTSNINTKMKVDRFLAGQACPWSNGT